MQIRKGYPNLYLMSHSKCPKLLQSWVAYLSAQDLRPVIWIQMWLHSPIHVGLLTSALIEVLALQPRFADHPRNRPMTLQVSVEHSLKTKLGTAKPDPRLPMIVASCSEHQPNDGKRWIFPTPSKCPAACKHRAVDRRSCSEKLSQSEQWQEHRNHHEPQQGPGQETATPRSPSNWAPLPSAAPPHCRRDSWHDPLHRACSSLHCGRAHHLPVQVASWFLPEVTMARVGPRTHGLESTWAVSLYAEKHGRWTTFKDELESSFLKPSQIKFLGKFFFHNK